LKTLLSRAFLNVTVVVVWHSYSVLVSITKLTYTSVPVSTGMGDRYGFNSRCRTFILSRYVTHHLGEVNSAWPSLRG